MTTKQGGSRSRLRKTFGFAAILIGLFVSMFGMGADLVDASTKVANPVPYNGNLDCADFGFAYEFKIDKQPTNGTFAVGDPGTATSGAVPPGTTITISNVELVNGRMEFDWSSNQSWGAVLVKQGSGGLRYPYDPAASDDQNVQTVTGANQGGISHVSFCGPGPVAPPTADVTLAKVTTGANAPAGGTNFTFTVTCETGTVPTSPVQIASGAAATTVATDVVVGSTCTITETVNQGAASTVYTVNGSAQPAGAQVVVTVTSAADVVVSAANDFPAPRRRRRRRRLRRLPRPW